MQNIKKKLLKNFAIFQSWILIGDINKIIKIKFFCNYNKKFVLSINIFRYFKIWHCNCNCNYYYNKFLKIFFILKKQNRNFKN